MSKCELDLVGARLRVPAKERSKIYLDRCSGIAVDHRCSSRHSGITRGIIRAGSRPGKPASSLSPERSPLQCHCARETVGRVFFLSVFLQRLNIFLVAPRVETRLSFVSRHRIFCVLIDDSPSPSNEGRDSNDDDRGQHQRRLTATKRKCSAAVCSALTKAQS